VRWRSPRRRWYQQWRIEKIDDNVRRILCIGAILDPRFKTIKETAPEFNESFDMDSVFEFELMTWWVPEESETVCSAVQDASTPTTTNSSLIPTSSRVSGGISMSRFLAHNKSLSPSSVDLTLKLCTTSDCCRVVCRIVSPAQTVPSGDKSPQTSEDEKTRLEYRTGCRCL
jgi:hypothetical protein